MSRLVSNVNAIRSMADQFEVAVVIDRCNEFVFRSPDIPLIDKFKMAELWQDARLVVSLHENESLTFRS